MATVNKRHTVVLGPVKAEILNLTAVSDTDTVSTLIQNPEFAVGVNNTDGETTSAALNVSISGKTLTINNANLTGSSEVNVIVVGF